MKISEKMLEPREENPYIKAAKRNLLPLDLTILQFQSIGDSLIPQFTNGIIPSKEVFEDVVKRCRAFFNEVSNEEIAPHNLEIYDEILTHGDGQVPENGEGYVYILQGGRYYKIGKTNNLTRRIAEISPKLPFETSLIHAIETDDANRLEAILHNKYTSKQVNGEWFDLDWEDIQWLISWHYIPFAKWLSQSRG